MIPQQIITILLIVTSVETAEELSDLAAFVQFLGSFASDIKIKLPQLACGNVTEFNDIYRLIGSSTHDFEEDDHAMSKCWQNCLKSHETSGKVCCTVKALLFKQKCQMYETQSGTMLPSTPQATQFACIRYDMPTYSCSTLGRGVEQRDCSFSATNECVAQMSNMICGSNNCQCDDDTECEVCFIDKHLDQTHNQPNQPKHDFLPSSVLPIECVDGMYVNKIGQDPSKSQNISCDQNRTWSKPEACVFGCRRKKKSAKDQASGIAQFSYSKSSVQGDESLSIQGDVAELKCKTGFKFESAAAPTTCGTDGKWSAWATCQQQCACPSIANIASTNDTDCNKYYDKDKTIEIECKEGYMWSDQKTTKQVTIKCGSGGAWKDIDGLKCIAITAKTTTILEPTPTSTTTTDESQAGSNPGSGKQKKDDWDFILPLWALILIGCSVMFLVVVIVGAAIGYSRHRRKAHTEDEDRRIQERAEMARQHLREMRPQAEGGTIPHEEWKHRGHKPLDEEALQNVPVPRAHALPANEPDLKITQPQDRVDVEAVEVSAHAISGRGKEHFLSEYGYDRRRDTKKEVKQKKRQNLRKQQQKKGGSPDQDAGEEQPGQKSPDGNVPASSDTPQLQKQGDAKSVNMFEPGQNYQPQDYQSPAQELQQPQNQFYQADTKDEYSF